MAKNYNLWFKFYIKNIYEKVFTSLTLEQRYILIVIQAMANQFENEWIFKGKKYTLKPGQLITSVKSIVESCNCKTITTRKVRTALKSFENLEILTIETTKENTLITILNWDKTQGILFGNDNVFDKQVTNKWQTDDKQMTNKWQTGDKQMTTIKKDNIDKIEKKDKKDIYIKPNTFTNYTQRQYTDDEIEEIIRRKSNI
ncbi:MAG: hypothetical protein ACI4VF_04915 [Lachnospirales bacterium]